MTTDKVVQVTVPEGTAPVAEVKPPEVKPPEVAQPITEERLQQLLAQQAETLKRSLQSEKDKAVAEVRREAEKALRRERLEKDAIKSSLRGYDADSGKSPAEALELAELRARDQVYQQSEVEETQRKQSEAYVQQLKTSLTDSLRELEIDPEDKRIDWAAEEPNYLTGRSRFDKSVAKIVKENRTKEKDSLEKRLKDVELRINKEANSVDTSVSGSASVESIPTDMAQFREYIANLPQKEFEAKQAKINEMLKTGKIK